MKKTRIVFILGKSCVAPLKQQTIPKLELQASVYASPLRKKLNEELTLRIDQTVHWSDSTSVLGWIYNRNKEQHKMFIANRIYEILEHSRKTEWRYVLTKDNPADEGTRGLPASKIRDSSWIKGPPFLLLTEEHWPTQPTSIPIPTEPLLNSTSLHCNSIPEPRLIDYSRFSSWTKVLSKTRAIFKVRNKMKNIQQTAAEINTTAQNFLSKQSAEEVFSKEKKDLQQRRSVSPKSPIINFNSFLDPENTLRSMSRLQNEPDSKNLKTPIILDARHPIVYLFIKHQHEKQGHIGVEHLRSV